MIDLFVKKKTLEKQCLEEIYSGERGLLTCGLEASDYAIHYICTFMEQKSKRAQAMMEKKRQKNLEKLKQKEAESSHFKSIPDLESTGPVFIPSSATQSQQQISPQPFPQPVQQPSLQPFPQPVQQPSLQPFPQSVQQSFPQPVQQGGNFSAVQVNVPPLQLPANVVPAQTHDQAEESFPTQSREDHFVFSGETLNDVSAMMSSLSLSEKTKEPETAVPRVKIKGGQTREERREQRRLKRAKKAERRAQQGVTEGN